MYQQRIKHLEALHAVLDKQIDGLERTGMFEDISLQTLKKQRLQLKDQLSDLRRQQYDHDQEVGYDD
jgi:uncharacterized protein YdcH (DUF465 family)